MNSKQVALKAAKHLMDLASIQDQVARISIGSDGRIDSKRYDRNKLELTEVFTEVILGVLDSKTRSAALEASKKKSNGTTRKSKD